MNSHYQDVPYCSLFIPVKSTETETTTKFIGNTYQVRKPIYQANQEKLNLKYRGIALNTDNSQIQKDQLTKKSLFVAKLISQLSFE